MSNNSLHYIKGIKHKTTYNIILINNNLEKKTKIKKLKIKKCCYVNAVYEMSKSSSSSIIIFELLPLFEVEDNSTKDLCSFNLLV